MKGPVWTAAHVETVRVHYGKLPVSLIARAVGRSESAVRNQGVRLGVQTGNWHAWTTGDLKYLRQAYAPRGALFVALQLRRSVDAVRAKAAELGIARDLHRLGLNKNGYRLWTADEDARLMAASCAEIDALAVVLNRSLQAVRVRRSKMKRRATLGGQP